jgi:hypothetical protein
MTELALFASAFAVVALLVFQQQNVHGRHYLLAALTSVAIGAVQIVLWRLIPSASWSEIAATLAGGPTGVLFSMWVHPRLVRVR